jgi:hypothetical protein
MNIFHGSPTSRVATAAALLVAVAAAGIAGQVGAQGPVTGIGSSHSVTVKATVKSVDLATRHAVLVGPSGETFTVKVSDDVRNLDQVRPGDTVKATYNRSLMYVLSARGAPLPADTEKTVAARAAKGELPAAAVANHVIITQTVLGVDTTDNTLTLASPQGGEVQTVSVVDPAAQKQLALVKVGDTITGYLTETLLISVNP